MYFTWIVDTTNVKIFVSGANAETVIQIMLKILANVTVVMN